MNWRILSKLKRYTGKIASRASANLLVRRKQVGTMDFWEFDSRGHELRYWQETGLAKGMHIYDNYLKLFGLDKRVFSDLAVCDFGCGPFGGILSVLPTIKAAYPVDVLAEDYNQWGISRFSIYPVINHKTPIPGEVCDVCFCTNALDHVPRPWQVVQEMARILKPGGSLYLHIHLRRPDQLSKAHRYVVTIDMIKQWFDADFVIRSSGTEGYDWVNDDPYEMFYAHLTKREQ